MQCETCGEDIDVDDGTIWYHTESMSAFCDPEYEERIDRQAFPAPAPMVGRWSTFGSNWVAECPVCHAVCVYWDNEDLNEDGELMCYHERTDA